MKYWQMVDQILEVGKLGPDKEDRTGNRTVLNFSLIKHSAMGTLRVGVASQSGLSLKYDAFRYFAKNVAIRILYN